MAIESMAGQNGDPKHADLICKCNRLAVGDRVLGVVLCIDGDHRIKIGSEFVERLVRVTVNFLTHDSQVHRPICFIRYLKTQAR